MDRSFLKKLRVKQSSIYHRSASTKSSDVIGGKQAALDTFGHVFTTAHPRKQLVQKGTTKPQKIYEQIDLVNETTTGFSFYSVCNSRVFAITDLGLSVYELVGTEWVIRTTTTDYVGSPYLDGSAPISNGLLTGTSLISGVCTDNDKYIYVFSSDLTMYGRLNIETYEWNRFSGLTSDNGYDISDLFEYAICYSQGFVYIYGGTSDGSRSGLCMPSSGGTPVSGRFWSPHLIRLDVANELTEWETHIQGESCTLETNATYTNMLKTGGGTTMTPRACAGMCADPVTGDIYIFGGVSEPHKRNDSTIFYGADYANEVTTAMAVSTPSSQRVEVPQFIKVSPSSNIPTIITPLNTVPRSTSLYYRIDQLRHPRVTVYNGIVYVMGGNPTRITYSNPNTLVGYVPQSTPSGNSYTSSSCRGFNTNTNLWFDVDTSIDNSRKEYLDGLGFDQVDNINHSIQAGKHTYFFSENLVYVFDAESGAWNITRVINPYKKKIFLASGEEIQMGDVQKNILGLVFGTVTGYVIYNGNMGVSKQRKFKRVSRAFDITNVSQGTPTLIKHPRIGFCYVIPANLLSIRYDTDMQFVYDDPFTSTNGHLAFIPDEMDRLEQFGITIAAAPANLPMLSGCASDKSRYFSISGNMLTCVGVKDDFTFYTVGQLNLAYHNISDVFFTPNAIYDFGSRTKMIATSSANINGRRLAEIQFPANINFTGISTVGADDVLVYRMIATPHTSLYSGAINFVRNSTVGNRYIFHCSHTWDPERDHDLKPIRSSLGGVLQTPGSGTINCPDLDENIGALDFYTNQWHMTVDPVRLELHLERFTAEDIDGISHHLRTVIPIR